MFLSKHYEIPFAKEYVTPFYLVNQDSPQDCIGQPETTYFASTAAIAQRSTISLTEQPRLRSWIGFAKP